MAVGPAGPEEYAEVLIDLLFNIHADAGPDGIAAHRVDVGRLPGRLRQRHRVGIFAHAATFQVARDLDLAGPAPQLVPLLEFADDFEIGEGRSERVAGRGVATGRPVGKIEDAGPNRPAPGVPLRCGAISVAPAVAGIVEGTGVDRRLAEEIDLGVVGIFVGVEDIDDAKPPNREHQAIGRARAGELIEVIIDMLDVATKVDGLTKELHAGVGIGSPSL